MNRAIQLEPNNPRLYVDRTKVKLFSLKDRSGAIKDLQQAANLFRQQGDTRCSELMLRLVKKYTSRSRACYFNMQDRNSFIDPLEEKKSIS